jgi:hypothetical protein
VSKIYSAFVMGLDAIDALENEDLIVVLDATDGTPKAIARSDASFGAGGGDFLADGTVPMTGDLDIGGNDVTNVGNVDGRDVSTDGAALDAHVGAANPHSGSLASAHEGAGGAVHADAIAGGAAGFMTGDDKTKLDAIESGADVTDAENVAAAGAVMDGDFAGSDTGPLTRTGAEAYAVRKDSLAASAAPGVTDDSDSGYSVGSLWIDTTGDASYRCVDATVGAAVWEAAAGGGSGDVVGPGSSTDNALTRFDGTGGKTIQNSANTTLSDAGTLTLAGDAKIATASGAALTVQRGDNTGDIAVFTDLAGNQIMRLSRSGTSCLMFSSYSYGWNGSTAKLTQSSNDLQLWADAAIKVQLGDTASPADGDSAMLLATHNGSTWALQRVTKGADDSGGSGFAVLRVPN